MTSAAIRHHVPVRRHPAAASSGSSYASSSTSATPISGRRSRAGTTRSSRSRSRRSGRRSCGSAPRSCPCTRAARTRSRRRSRRCARPRPGRFALGIGTSSDVIVERWNGMVFDKPYQRVRDTIRFLRAALTGEKVDEEYETFTCATASGSASRFPSSRRSSSPRCAQGMLRLAGREGDGAIINWLSADDVKTVVPHVGAGKEIVGAHLRVSRPTTPGLVRAVGKRAIASYLTVPVYAAFHEWLGRGEELADLWRLWKEGDRKAAAESIPDSVRRRPPRVGQARGVQGAHRSATWRTVSPHRRPRCSAAPTRSRASSALSLASRAAP